MNFPLHIANKYVFSGKNAIEVNVISWISFIALGFVTACLIVILSVFSGLEEINLQLYSNINPDARISTSKGKTMKTGDLVKKILKLPEVKTASQVIEERAFADYNNKNHIVTIKGVDSNFDQIFRLDTMVQIGKPLSSKLSQNVILGQEVASRLSLYIDNENPLVLYVPKPGEGLITRKDQAFNAIKVYANGVFVINEKYRDYIFTNIELARQFLNYKPNEVTSIEVKSAISDKKQFLKSLRKVVGRDFKVESREEIDAAFTKMMNIENLMIYLIFILILIIASFNLAGSVAILILNKKDQTETLRSLGMSKKQIKKTFFYTGLLITFYALLVGLFVGTVIVLIQKYFGVVSVNSFRAFPVKFMIQNYLLSISSVLVIGTVVSYFVSQQISFSSEK